jgi:pSer/pThr/pTyr-binding forkhead associated (FHA) protein
MLKEAPAERDPLARHSLSPQELKALLAFERNGEPFLAFRDTLGGLGLYRLDGDRQHTLGRGPEMDLSLPWDGEISSLHAELRCLGGEWALVDDGLSTNGTYINGQRVSGRVRLRGGDLLRLGQTTLAYNAARGAELMETVSAGERPADRPLTDTQRRVLVALCRPYRDRSSFATPATNQQIADEVCLSVDAVKTHLRALFAKLELADLPQNQKRTRLAECALRFGLVGRSELE